MGHSCLYHCWSISQKSEVIPYKQLKWNNVLKTMKTVHRGLPLWFPYYILLFLESFSHSWWTLLLLPFLFQPTCQPFRSQQMLMWSTSVEDCTGAYMRWVKTPHPALSECKHLHRRTHLWNHKCCLTNRASVWTWDKGEDDHAPHQMHNFSLKTSTY